MALSSFVSKAERDTGQNPDFFITQLYLMFQTYFHHGNQ